jgi:FAD/FMN-containing dehydrogenase
MAPSDVFLAACRDIVGAAHVLTQHNDVAGFETDQRKRYTGRARAVILPASTEEVAAIVTLCSIHRVPVVPQGGNTGLVLGSVPDTSGQAIILSLTRMNQVRAVDAINNTITVDAGCILHNVQTAADHMDRLFPLSLASEGSCTIGGNLSTNAGGTAVLRYGNARELCLGLEVVTANGNILHGLRGLRKDNTGYDLRHLYMGAEGTLGIITAAVLKLFPKPKATLTALVALPTVQQALTLLTLAQAHCGATLTAFELMSQYCLDLVHTQLHQTLPFKDAHPQYVLLEISDNISETHARDCFESLVTAACEQKIITDAVIASSIAQSRALWTLRESISAAQAKAGNNLKHDIAVPVSEIAAFITATDALLQTAYPGCRNVTFGHVGDGNLHYNVSPPEHITPQAFLAEQAHVNRIVHDCVHRFNGSISAEHGIGALKRDELTRYKSDVELQVMRSIKQALDPYNIMNPGKVLDMTTQTDQ